ncbi:MAG: hypothetical protein Hyperionvirus18_26 [Hyperionvirus sp.]|uniref:Sel1 repeat family protein n=1 Tax=Hyperionvirus sp. TaxID=2487770 RepID=A0A3G5AA70_9VIRU|nr:MAG: hypothetical protein Hyperionvirus18_26 [Hyperionvirus sp.]
MTDENFGKLVSLIDSCVLGENYLKNTERLLNWINLLKGDEVKKVFDWLQKKEHPTAAYLIGKFYEEGKGVDKNIREALLWYLKAAELNNTFAMFDLGAIYQFDHVERNYDEALKWYMKAYELGDKFVINNIGVMYYEGSGVEKDFNIALKWFLEAKTSNSFLNVANIYEQEGKYLDAIEYVTLAYNLLEDDEKQKLHCVGKMNRIFKKCNVELLTKWVSMKGSVLLGSEHSDR